MVRSFGAFSTGVLAGAASAFGSPAGRCRVSGQGRLVDPAPIEGHVVGATGANEPEAAFVSAGEAFPAEGDVGAGTPDMGTGAIRVGGVALGAQLEQPAAEMDAGTPHAPPEE